MPEDFTLATFYSLWGEYLACQRRTFSTILAISD